MMNDPVGSEQASGGTAGLCARCAHVQIIVSAKGSRFYLCRLSLVNPRFPKYPTLPVLQCSGYQPAGDRRP
jgi:hypothetical protein